MAKEYIEREALLDEINIAPVSMSICMNVDECKGRIYERERLARTINDAPAADVVEVVRCRECIYWEPASPTRTSGNCNRSFDIPAWATDFCSYGKRKDGGQDE